MIKKAFFRANIPFTVSSNIVFAENFVDTLSENGWLKTEIQGDFLLKHINTSLNKNVVCFSKACVGINISVPMCDPVDQSINKNYNFTISEIGVYCFDTGVGIISFHIPYDDLTNEETLVNTCSILRCSVQHREPSNGRALLQNCAETYLSCLAEEQLSTLLGSDFTLFSHFNENSLRRVDMFSAVLCDSEIADNDLQAYDKLCYRLAYAYDNRDKDIVLNERDFYRQHDYIRWSYSKRGCSVVANLTGIPSSDSFLENRWLFSVKSNYFYIYLMVLHQKYAIYNYLNTVASDTENEFIKSNQEALIDFNSKYIFSIVSDEQFIQSSYLRMKEVNNVDEVYSDLQDELKRLFEYSQLKNDENNEIRNTRLNIISVIISFLCSVTIIFDTINMFSTHGWHPGIGSKGDILCLAAIIVEAILFATGFWYICKINKKKN